MKTVFVAIFITLSAILNAQSIIGSWNKVIVEKPEETANYSVTYSEDNRFNEDLLISMKFPVSAESEVSIQLLITYNGIWSLSEETLSQTLDKKSLNVEVLDSQGLPDSALTFLKNRVMSEFKKRMKGTLQYKVLTVNDKQFVIQEAKSKKTQEFARKG